MDWTTIALAAATATALHRMLEPDNLFRKLRRLDNAIKTGKLDELPMKGIDTRPKAYAVGLVFTAVPFGIAYAIFATLDLEVETAFMFIAIVTLASEIVLLARLDRFHVAIEKVTKAQIK